MQNIWTTKWPSFGKFLIWLFGKSFTWYTWPVSVISFVIFQRNSKNCCTFGLAKRTFFHLFSVKWNNFRWRKTRLVYDQFHFLKKWNNFCLVCMRSQTLSSFIYLFGREQDEEYFTDVNVECIDQRIVFENIEISTRSLLLPCNVQP